MDDKADGFLDAGPQFEQLGIEVIADDFIERAKRLVHQQQIGIERQRLAMEALCCMPPESCQGYFYSKLVKLTSSIVRAMRSVCWVDE